MDEQQTPAPEAGDEAVTDTHEDQASEATENTEGQEQDQPAEDEPSKDDKAEEENSPSKARRERRKAEMERLRQSEAEARQKYDAEVARREQIKKAAQSSQPPKEADFSDYNDYLMAAGAYHAAKAWDDRQSRDADEKVSAHEKQLQEIRQQQEAELAQSWASQRQEAETRYADFAQVALNPNLPVTQEMGQMIASSDQGADVLYYLGSHPQEAAEIARMQPLEAARRLGAIEARMSLPKPNTQSKTPEPINPVKGRAGNVAKDPDRMTNAEYRAWRESGGSF